MSSSTHHGGQKVADRGNKVLSTEAVKLLKTQDAGYLRTMAQKTKRARERLEREFVLVKKGQGGVRVLGGAGEVGRGVGRKVVWVDNTEEQRRYGVEKPASKKMGEIPEGFNEDEDLEPEEANAQKRRPKKSSMEDQASKLKMQRALRKKRKREQEARRFRLEALKIRERDLVAAERELEIQRAKMSSSIGGITKAGLKWKVRERKR